MYGLQSSIPATPSASRSCITIDESSIAAHIINTDDYDCVYQDYGCDWCYSDYSGGGSSCGASPYEAGEKLSDGHVILAVSQDGSGDCVSNAGSKCCTLLEDNPCNSGYKYLDCAKA